MSAKPRVLILGGCGFIGRHLVHYLVSQSLCAHIRVADKVMPIMSYLSPELEKSYESVEFKQADLSQDAHVTRAFDDKNGSWDMVINLAAETRYGQDEKVYTEKVVGIVKKCAAEAAKRGVKRWVEVSTAQVYEEGKKPSKEDGKCKPWTKLARAKLEAETVLREQKAFEVVFLRPAVVYGPGDTLGIMPRVICGAAYKQMGEKMKFLWNEDLRVHTVHVRDVARAIWHVAVNGAAGAVYNVADKGDTTQEKIADILAEVYGIKTGFVGSMMSNLAKLKMDSIVEDANDTHMQPWSELCKSHKILNTPLSPFIDQELLYNNALSVDGSALEATGFVYEVPKISSDLIREQIKYFQDLKLFPPLQ
jgi:nucleoside-diphosphate-sugar epimerase